MLLGKSAHFVPFLRVICCTKMSAYAYIVLAKVSSKTTRARTGMRNWDWGKESSNITASYGVCFLVLCSIFVSKTTGIFCKVHAVFEVIKNEILVRRRKEISPKRRRFLRKMEFYCFVLYCIVLCCIVLHFIVLVFTCNFEDVFFFAKGIILNKLIIERRTTAVKTLSF